MNELDFSGKQVLVVGGSSGIGNGIAQDFRARGARVHVCGTRAAASDYSAEDGSQLDGLQYSQLDVSNGSILGRGRKHRSNDIRQPQRRVPSIDGESILDAPDR